MPKSKYVLICLLWLLHYPLSTSHAVDTGAPMTFPLADPDQKILAVTHEIPSPKSVQEEVATPKKPEATTTTQGQPPTQTDEENLPLGPTDPGEVPAAASLQPDIATQEPQGAIQSIIHYEAEESMFFDIKNKTVRLYGGGTIEHDTIKLEAEEIFLDWTKHTIAALSKKNEAGEIQKKAVFTRDEVEYFAESVRYNLDSKRGVANNSFNKQDDGLFRANKIKQDREDTFYADKGTYTTCNLTKPHFHVEATNIKMTQNDKVISGPFKFYFDNVPTPLGFASGVFYFLQKSGILFPKYGGESGKGFCLREGGYYFKFNDYVDLALKGEIYSKGSTGLSAESQYKKRYQYNGNLYYKRRTHVSTLEDRPVEKDWKFEWNHATENSRTSSLNAKVELSGQSSKEQSVLLNGERPQGTVSSSIRYMNKLVGLPYTLNASLQHTKDFKKQETIANMPSISLGTGSIYPFRKHGKAGDGWHSNIYFQHTVQFDNRLSNIIDDKKVDFSPKNWGLLFRNGKYGVEHEIPLYTNIKVLKYLNLKPALRYREQWYWEKMNYKDNNDPGEKIQGFERVSDYSFGAELTTTLYGTYHFSPHATVQTIRHELTPAVTFTYIPDFSDPKYGYWQTMRDGSKRDRFKEAIFRKSYYGTPASRAKAVMKIDLSSRLDMKVKNTKEGEKSTKKVPILESFDWSTEYDFLADEFALEDIKLSTRTHLFKDLFDIRFDSIFDPYIYKKIQKSSIQDEEKRINEFAWKHGQGIGRVKSASVSIGTRLSPSGRENILEQYDDLEEDEEEDVKEELKHIQEHPDQYIDFKIPWSLDLDYKWGYDRDKSEGNKITQTLSFDGNISLTKKWKVSFSSAYDITEKKLMDSSTRIGIHRDLHCWEMNFDWHPLGDRKHYEFSIGLKSPLLQDLKYSRSRGRRD